MTAGTSTGSILAAGLAYPDKNNTELTNQNINTNYKPDETFIKPGFFAEDLINIYSLQAKDIFKKRRAGWIEPVSIIFFLALFGFLSYKLGIYWYDNEDMKLALEDLKKANSNAKR